MSLRGKQGHVDQRTVVMLRLAQKKKVERFATRLDVSGAEIIRRAIEAYDPERDACGKGLSLRCERLQKRIRNLETACGELLERMDRFENGSGRKNSVGLRPRSR